MIGDAGEDKWEYGQQLPNTACYHIEFHLFGVRWRAWSIIYCHPAR